MSATRPLANPALVRTDVDGEFVVYDPRTGMFHYLNPAVSLVFDLCDGTATTKEMAAAIADVYERQVSEIETNVHTIVDRLQHDALLAPSGWSPEDSPPRTADDVDQREQIRLEVPRSS